MPGLYEEDMDPDPYAQFARWYEEAQAAGVVDAEAMTLATATPDGLPSARTVLLRGFGESGFTFYTNYASAKGRELAANPQAALVLLWREQGRQVRVTGRVSRLSDEESDAYFESRPEGSQVAAWASQQSEVLESRKVLDDKYAELVADYQDRPVLRPPWWGGYGLVPDALEFWQRGDNRLHDRLRYRWDGDRWVLERLSP